MRPSEFHFIKIQCTYVHTMYVPVRTYYKYMPFAFYICIHSYIINDVLKMGLLRLKIINNNWFHSLENPKIIKNKSLKL